jgi:hypothetical protein
MEARWTRLPHFVTVLSAVHESCISKPNNSWRRPSDSPYLAGARAKLRSVTPPWASTPPLLVISPDIVSRLDPTCPAISGVKTQALRLRSIPQLRLELYKSSTPASGLSILLPLSQFAPQPRHCPCHTVTPLAIRALLQLKFSGWLRHPPHVNVVPR